MRDLEIQLENLKQAQQAPTLSAEDRAKLMTHGKDLARAWNSPGASTETRKQIVRLMGHGRAAGVEHGEETMVLSARGGVIPSSDPLDIFSVSLN